MIVKSRLKSAQNAISEHKDFKIFLGGMPRPPRLSCFTAGLFLATTLAYIWTFGDHDPLVMASTV